MRYEPIDSTLFSSNRARLKGLLKPKSMAIVLSNDVIPSNADGTLGFKQNNDLFYLTGIDQEESILILFPDFPDENFREILLIRETSEHIKIWEGEKLSKEQATEISGIKKVVWVNSFEPLLRKLVFEAEQVYLNLNEHDGADWKFQTRERRFVNDFKLQFPLHQLERLAPLMRRLRVVKQAAEIDLLKKAIGISGGGLRRMAKFLKPDVYEFELEAELTHEFLMNRSRGHAFQPIIASGANACVLHYVTNNERCKDGDLVLLDFGAEYANYNADITRCLPVNGRFSERQKAVYQAVLRILYAAREMIVSGNTMEKLRKETGKIVEYELIELGLLKRHEVAKQDPEAPLYRKYFPHGISHHLGLDVHDVGSRYETFKPGMVFTCEPGIYIPEEKLGIRLENDILITAHGNIDLMDGIPISVDEIEHLMNN
ncbi:aminopeptidase P N-terminal domain-containing protein [Emticicia sp. 21SJ11W-3]|uniref:aminopeptidase P N-terminal domain-containing protein n=1 Tax=Emticicia sp. 21SJ11W-3 TaxID=2916755 RepID=UPI0020A1C59A|nr:aminopeptidase P N-terminal domain-containing protein [Emticicia sp. 21SJ11W-3]UTA70204.1 aminopeptidase P N-terminal domain-containing protein [Emticicia sp. 21SJ11W-3]